MYPVRESRIAEMAKAIVTLQKEVSTLQKATIELGTRLLTLDTLFNALSAALHGWATENEQKVEH